MCQEVLYQSTAKTSDPWLDSRVDQRKLDEGAAGGICEKCGGTTANLCTVRKYKCQAAGKCSGIRCTLHTTAV